MRSADELKKIYKGTSFHKRKDQRNAQGVVTAYDGGYFGIVDYNSTPNSGLPTPSEISNITGGSNNPYLAAGSGNLNSTATNASDLPTQASLNLLSDSQLNNGSSGSGSQSQGALANALKALGLGGGNTSANGITALAGLLGAAGQYSQNKALTPTFSPPAMFGGSAGTASGAQGAGSAAGTPSTGFGPSGGYNYSNYKGLTGSSPSTGLGYAPRTQTNPNIPNYYTYGQQPQSSFFTSATPAVGTAPTSMNTSPVNMNTPPAQTMARGGKVKSTPQRYDAGGMIQPPMSGGMPTAPPPMQPRPPMQPIQPPAGAPPMPQRPGSPPMQGMPGTQNGGGIAGAVMPQMQQRPPTPPMPQRPGAPQVAPRLNPGMQRPMMADGGSVPSLAGGGMYNSQMGPNPANASNITSNTAPLQALMQNWRHAGANTTHPYASGGSDVSRHVKGPGDGTSDSIPARLANGEYVMDAQTVSMLGNGDNGSGAKALDAFRSNIRKHKGAALSKGKMAPDAKQPHQYLGGK